MIKWFYFVFVCPLDACYPISYHWTFLLNLHHWICVLYIYIYFLYLGFLSQIFTNHRTAGEGGGHFFNSSLQLPPAAHSQQSDSNWEPLVSERKSLTNKLHPVLYMIDYVVLIYQAILANKLSHTMPIPSSPNEVINLKTSSKSRDFLFYCF